MKCHFLCGIAIMLLISGCGTSGKLSVGSVAYQSLRTEFSQPSYIPDDAKIAVEFFFNSEGKMQPVVYNLTSEVLVLDQTKSCVIMPDGSSVPYYDSTAQTPITGSSFNLGDIAGASSTDGIMRQNTVTITDQPRVYIRPKECVAMSKAYTIRGVGKKADLSENVVDVPMKASPVKFSVCVTYSFDNGATFDKLVTNIYVSSNLSIPVIDRKVSNAFYGIYKQKPDALAENMYMFMMPNNIGRISADLTGEFLAIDNIYDTYIRGSLIDFQ